MSEIFSHLTQPEAFRERSFQLDATHVRDGIHTGNPIPRDYIDYGDESPDWRAEQSSPTTTMVGGRALHAFAGETEIDRLARMGYFSA